MGRPARAAAVLGVAIGAAALAALRSDWFAPGWLATEAGPPPLSAATERASFVGAAQCAACHEDATRSWRVSDHANAMRTAGPSSVAGDFSDRTYVYAGTK